MKRLVIILLAVLVPILGVFMLTSTAYTQSQSQTYIPKVATEQLEGNFPAIGILTCSDWDNDGIDENTFAMSKEVFDNGKPLEEIRKHYHMLPDDLGKINNKFFPNGVIDAHQGKSAVCLPSKYNALFVEVTGDVTKDFILNYNGGVPGWEQNLWNAPDVQVSQQVTETFAILGFAITAESWYGAPVVGTLERGGQVWGTIIKYVPSVSAVQLIGRAISSFVVIDALYQRIYAATSEGVTMPATLLTKDGKAAVVYYAIPTERAYVRFYDDAVTAADNMLVPNIRRLYLSGEENKGVIVTSQPQGGMGDQSYLWDAATQAALSIVAQKEKAFTEQDGRDIADAWEQLIKQQDDDPDNNPVPLPVDPSYECPRIWGVVAEDLLVEAIYASITKMAEGLERARPEEFSYYSSLIEFTEQLQEILPELEMGDRYDTVRPRSGMVYHLAHLTSQAVAPDSLGRHWTVEAVCFPAGGTYLWLVNVAQGRLGSGVTSTMPYGQDFVWKRPHLFNDVAF